MSKYFDTKPGSLEEAVSAAQQAAIAISKKEKEEKTKDENNFIYAAKMAKKNGEKTFTIGSKEYNVEDYIEEEVLDENQYYEYKFKNKNDAMAAKKMLDAVQLMSFEINDDNISNGELMVDAGKKNMSKYHNEILKKFKPKVMKSETNKNDKSDDGEGLDAVQPKAVKKKFADRKDKDIDNDGDVDDSDKFLHKRRKAVSKSMKSEEMDPTDHVKKKDDKYCVYNADGSIAKEFDNKEDADKYAIDNHDKLMATKKEEVKEETLAMKAAKHIASMWEDSAKAKEAKVKEEEEEPKKKESKTAMTGKPMAGVEVNPKESKDK